MDAHTNMSIGGRINFTKMLLKKLKILTLTYLLMNMMLVNVNIKFYALIMI